MLCGGPKVSETPQKLHSDVTLWVDEEIHNE